MNDAEMLARLREMDAEYVALWKEIARLEEERRELNRKVDALWEARSKLAGELLPSPDIFPLIGTR